MNNLCARENSCYVNQPVINDMSQRHQTTITHNSHITKSITLVYLHTELPEIIKLEVTSSTVCSDPSNWISNHFVIHLDFKVPLDEVIGNYQPETKEVLASKTSLMAALGCLGGLPLWDYV